MPTVPWAMLPHAGGASLIGVGVGIGVAVGFGVGLAVGVGVGDGGGGVFDDIVHGENCVTLLYSTQLFTTSRPVTPCTFQLDPSLRNSDKADSLFPLSSESR